MASEGACSLNYLYCNLVRCPSKVKELKYALRKNCRLGGSSRVYWDRITKHLHINPQVMANFMGYARESANEIANEIAGNQEMTFDTFSLILTKSTKDQHPHLDLENPLVQYGMILSDDVISKVCYHDKNLIDTDTISDVPKLFSKLFQLFKI